MQLKRLYAVVTPTAIDTIAVSANLINLVNLIKQLINLSVAYCDCILSHNPHTDWL